jgi:hypothetical protein
MRTLISNRRVAVTVLAASAVIGAALSGSASAKGDQVTKGDFHAFSAGADAGMNIGGHAEMVRNANGTTKVTIHVTGLVPGTTYPSHVHQAACNSNFADGHYKFDPSGPAAPPNEIWPGPFTANSAGVGNSNTKVDGTAGPTAVSVVVHNPDGSKIACADLS